MKKVLTSIRSLKLSLLLMVMLIPVIAAGNLIPQIGREAPWVIRDWEKDYPFISRFAELTGLNHVYTSWWFLAVFTVLFLNMSLITWSLIWRTKRKSRGLHRFSEEAIQYFSMGKLAFSQELWDRFAEEVRKRRYRIIAENGEIYSQKGWIGIWGGTILHVGLVVVLIGAVISGLTRFSGYTEAGEGQGFVEQRESYLQMSSGPLFPGHRPEYMIGIKNIEYKDVGKMKVVTSSVELMRDDSVIRTKNVRMNDPLYFRGMKVFQSRHAGPALLFSVSHPMMQLPIAGYVHLKKAEKMTTSSIFSLGTSPFQAKASYLPGENAIDLEMREKERVVYQGPLKVGESITDDSWTIGLAGINKWSGIIVVYDWAVPVIFGGFLLTVVGIAVMGIFDPRELWVKRAEVNGRNTIDILGWARWKNMFLDEFEEMREGVEKWKR